MKNIIIVGCGLCGGVIARQCAEAGFKVSIIERRNHIAGNLFDFRDEHGILIQKYGPHTFHTNKKEIFEYISKFSEWVEYHVTCGAVINNICTPTPFNFKTIDDFYSINEATNIKEHITNYYKEQKTATVLELLNHEDPVIKDYALFLFKNDYSLYTAKQWGISPDKVDPSILKRVPLRFDYKVGYFDDKYQYMPKESFLTFFTSLIDHPNIDVFLNTDANEHIKIIENKIFYDGEELKNPLVYTGPIDELFNYKEGILPYRSLRFEFVYEDIESKQDMPVVAYPQVLDFTRITEFKKLPIQKCKGTTYAVEYPLQYEPNSDSEPYYPLLTAESINNYQKYNELSKQIPNLYLCGRLANYKYYNMDQAIEAALSLSDELIHKFLSIDIPQNL